MEVLVHFIFEIVKIAILASLYSTLLLFLFKLLTQKFPNSWLKRLTKDSKKFWFIAGALISISFYVWLFSYWGNHGLGDNARIPIGYKKQIEQIDGSWMFISPDGHEHEMFSINSYAVKGHYCSGQMNENTNQYYIWNLKTNKIEFVLTKEEYRQKVKEIELPNMDEFQEFWEAYKSYWGGWRFWLLP